MENESVNAVAGSLVDAPGIFREPETAPAPTNELGKDAFLKLLVAQLRYQDPLEPSSSDEFIATTAQFTVVEKLDELTKQGENTALVNSLTTASSLVGREVTATRSGVPVTGVVEESRIVSGVVQLQTTAGAIGLDEIISVGAAPTPAPEVIQPVAALPSPDETDSIHETAPDDETVPGDAVETTDAAADTDGLDGIDGIEAADETSDADAETNTDSGIESEDEPEPDGELGIGSELTSAVESTVDVLAEPSGESPAVDQPVIPNVRVDDEDLTDVEPSDQSTQVAATADVQPDAGDERNNPIEIDGEDDGPASAEADDPFAVPAPDVVPQSPVQSADEVETATNTPFDPFAKTV